MVEHNTNMNQYNNFDIVRISNKVIEFKLINKVSDNKFKLLKY